MPITTRNLLDQYTEILQKIYGKHLKKVVDYQNKCQKYELNEEYV